MRDNRLGRNGVAIEDHTGAQILNTMADTGEMAASAADDDCSGPMPTGAAATAPRPAPKNLRLVTTTP